MEARVAKIETKLESVDARLYAIEKSIAVIQSNYVTREDMHKEFGSLTWKLVGIIVLAQLLPAMPGMLKAIGWL